MLGLIRRKRRQRADQAARLEAAREAAMRLRHMHGVIIGIRAGVETTDALAECGWTATDLERLEFLSQHAMTHATALVTYSRCELSQQRPPAQDLHCFLVYRAGDLAVFGEMPVDQARLWLAALASEPELDRFEEALRASSSRKDFGPTWHAAAGDLAPLAWLAGLTMRESAAQRAAGTLDRETLATLAVLRGVPVAGALLEAGRSTTGAER